MSLELSYFITFYYLLFILLLLFTQLFKYIYLPWVSNRRPNPTCVTLFSLCQSLTANIKVSLQICSHEWIQRSSTRNVRFAQTSSHQHNSRELVKSVIVYNPGRSHDPIKVLERRIFVDLERTHDMQKGQRWLTLHLQMIIKYVYPWKNIGRMTIKMVPDRFKL